MFSYIFILASILMPSLFCHTIERDIKVVRPLYSVEVTETEIARFEVEISEADIHATWKLKGEVLHQSAVRCVPTIILSVRQSLNRFQTHVNMDLS